MRFVPPPLWVVVFIVGTYWLSLAPGLRDIPRFPASLLASIFVAFAATLLISLALLQFHRARTQVLPLSTTNNALVTTGVFSVSRNPMYLGMVLYCLGVAIAVGIVPMLLAPVLMFAVANFVFIPFEEAKMRRQFGDAFDAYTKRVRRWI